MAITEYNYIPKYIKRTIANKPKDVVTANYWNELFNLLITQGDRTAEELGNILNHFTGVITDLTNDTSQSTSGLSNKLGNLNNLATIDKSNLVASINEVKNTTDTKQDKLIAGKNINIAEDGKTISATQVIEVALEEQNDGSYAADITFAQLKAEVESGKQLMLVKDESRVFVLNKANDSAIEFLGADVLGITYVKITATVNEVWEVESALTPNTNNISEIFSDIGVLANLRTSDKTHLVAAINEVKTDTDLALNRINYYNSTKQDKLIAGENITIAEDGKTISAAGKANVLGYFRATCTGQSVEDFTLDKTFAQVKEEIANNNKVMLVDNFDYDCVFIMTYNGSSTVVFTGMVEDAGAWVIFSVTSDDKWQLDIQSRVTFDQHLELSNRVGATLNLTTTDKTNLVAAINEVKGIADDKQDKLIAGANITIAADGKTISATGGSSVPKPLTYDYMPEGYPSKSGWSVEWDGNTDGLISAGVFYKVSDMVPTDDELIGATLLSSTGREFKLTSDMITAISEDITAILDGEGGLVVRKDNAIFDANTVLPQKGIYSMKYLDAFTSKLSNQTTTPMAEEFLPPIDVPTKTSELENDSGYLTLATLPKYEGVVE